MSATTPSERQTGLKTDGREQVQSAEAGSRAPGSRSLEAGSEFLKALASDLAAMVSRFRRSLNAKHRHTRPPRISVPRHISWGSVCERVLRFLRVAFWGLASSCAVVLFGFTLWVLYGSPIQPRSSDVHSPGLRFETRKGETLGVVGPLQVTGASRQDLAREPGPQSRPIVEATIPSIAPSNQSGSSSAGAADQEKTSKEAQTEAGAGAAQPQPARTEMQERRSTVRALTDTRPRMQCNVDLCAATYKSFHAADCTYQPYGGAPRSVCELNTQSADRPAQISRAVTEERSEADNTRVAERAEEDTKSANPALTGPQCNLSLCGATYRSFRAADCTYQPYSGGPRRVCEQ
jgi:hypothetical protein